MLQGYWDEITLGCTSSKADTLSINVCEAGRGQLSLESSCSQQLVKCGQSLCNLWFDTVGGFKNKFSQGWGIN